MGEISTNRVQQWPLVDFLALAFFDPGIERGAIWKIKCSPSKRHSILLLCLRSARTPCFPFLPFFSLRPFPFICILHDARMAFVNEDQTLAIRLVVGRSRNALFNAIIEPR